MLSRLSIQSSTTRPVVQFYTVIYDLGSTSIVYKTVKPVVFVTKTSCEDFKAMWYFIWSERGTSASLSSLLEEF